MAGNATFESSELVFSGTYLNGQRGIRSAAVGPNFDRPGNFREGSEGRMFGSGLVVPRGGSSPVVGSDDFHTLSECLPLEPIVISDQIVWYDELRRVMGISVGSTAEENGFRAASASHVKPLPPVAVVKDLKRFRLSVEDSCVKARVRANNMDERLRKLDRYREAVTSKKQKRSELVSNDRAGALNMKMGTQLYNVNQRVEDRPKNLLLNKRVRTSVAESRSECQINVLQRQPVAMEKEGNLLEENNGESDLVEKIRRLAAGGEGWDKKIKRKRSVGAVCTRPIDSGATKRAVQNKVVDERGSQPLDAHIHSPVTKNKPSRTAQGGSMAAASSSPMGQWAGQRPQKMARVRRPNMLFHVSNQDEKLLSFEGCSPSETGTRISFNGTDDSPISKNPTNGHQKLTVKLDNVKSSPQLPESEESVGVESRLMYKEMGNNNEDVIAKKNKRFSNAATPKPFQSNKAGCKKNESKPGRRLKRLSDHKGLSHHPLQNSSSPDCNDVLGASVDDREELLAAANHARVASRLACSSAFWKIMDPVFSFVSLENKSFLNQQVDLPSIDSKFDAHSSWESRPHIQHQETKFFSGRNDLEKTSKWFMPLYQRVLSSLILEDDDIDTLEEGDARNMQVQNGFGVSTYDTYKSFPRNGGISSFRSSIRNHIYEDVNSEIELFAGISNGLLNTSHNFQTEVADSFSLDDKILLELQSIGLCPDILPCLDDTENEAILNEVNNLKTRLREQEVKKKAYFEKIREGVESSSAVKELEMLAMDKLVELAYRKFLGTRRSSRSGIQKVPKQVAVAFGKRTLARCRKFQNSGTSCFNEPPFQDILSAPIENEPDPLLSSDEVFAMNGRISNRGKKKELFLDDIAIRPQSVGGTKGKRSERDPTKSRKPKPRQKTGQQLPPTGNRPTGPIQHPTGPTQHPTGPTRRDVRFASSNPMVDDLDGLDELGVDGSHDLNSFLNFDEQVPDEDFAGGLDIPMDDLAELF